MDEDAVARAALNSSKSLCSCCMRASCSRTLRISCSFKNAISSSSSALACATLVAAPRSPPPYPPCFAAVARRGSGSCPRSTPMPAPLPSSPMLPDRPLLALPELLQVAARGRPDFEPTLRLRPFNPSHFVVLYAVGGREDLLRHEGDRGAGCHVPHTSLSLSCFLFVFSCRATYLTKR